MTGEGEREEGRRTEGGEEGKGGEGGRREEGAVGGEGEGVVVVLEELSRRS